MYTPYPTCTEIVAAIPEDVRADYILKASRKIDTLTYNRIVGRFEDLTDFQKDLIIEVNSRLAFWEYDNADVLSLPLTGYSINGVSAQFGNNYAVINGVAIPQNLYNLLQQTGLSCRSFRW